MASSSTAAPATAAQAEPVIQADPTVVGNWEDENDSTADADSLRDSTASITSSILEYRTINGRSYQSSKTTEYWAPTDEKHIEGFDVQHHYTMMLLDNKLFAAPISENPQKILDIGTGTGIWAIDVADEYPSADILATDISAVQPNWTPPNCSFQIDDAQLPWTFKQASFDYIHVRYLYGGISDWPFLYRQAFAATKPGGWFEHMEVDLETRSENPKVAEDDNHVFRQWRNLFWEAGEKLGRTFKIARDGRMEQYAHDAGFVDIVHKAWKVPIGGWAKDKTLKQVGLYNGLFIDQSIDGFAVYPIGEVLGWSFEEVQVLVAQMRTAIKDPKSLPYYVVHMVYGRRPEDTTAPSPPKDASP